MENFGPYKDPLEYEINQKTLTLITGPNGVGKTMSLDAIPYTLYGMTSKGARGDDVVNNEIEKNCHTWVEFEIDGQDFRLDRYHKYTKLGNTVILKRGDEVINKGHMEVVPVIESMILPRKLFMNTMMFGQKVKDFFTDLTDSEKKDIFRMVLQLEKYIDYQKNMKESLETISKMRQELSRNVEVKQARINDLEEQHAEQLEKEKRFYQEKEEKIKQIQSSIQTSERLKRQWESKIKEIEQEIDSYDLEQILNEDRKIRSDLQNIDQRWKTVEDENEKKKESKKQELNAQANEAWKNITEEYTEILSKIHEEIAEEEKLVREFETELAAIRSSVASKKSSKESQQKIYENEIKRLEKVLNSESKICPTCGQSIGGGYAQSVLNQKKSYHEEIKKLEDEFEKYAEEMSSDYDFILTENGDHKSELEKLNEKHEKIKREEQEKKELNQEKLKELLEKVDEISEKNKAEIEKNKDAEKVELEKALNDLKPMLDEVEKLQTEMDKIKNDTLQSIVVNIMTLNRQLEEVQESEFDKVEIEKIEARIYILKEEISKIAIDEEKFISMEKIASFWKDGFSAAGIPSMLIDEAIPFMNETVEKYLDQISNGRYIVSFDTLAETKSGEFRDKISVRFLDTKTKASQRVQLSGGQTRLVDIATILTLGDLQSEMHNTRFNILLFDEIFDSLDDDNISYVSRVLRKLADDKAIFIISHRHVDHLEADQVYNFYGE